MAVVIRQPTAFETPDSSQVIGDTAVTGASVTGHDSTVINVGSLETANKTCRWSGFAAVAGVITGIRLKFNWSENGFTDGGSNRFHIQRSVDGGSNWVDVFDHTAITAVGSGSVDVALPVQQDVTTIQVRDRLLASGAFESVASVTGAISSIQLEVTTQDAQVIVMMNKEWEVTW